MKFTDRYLKSLTSRESRYETLEGMGFGVRVSPGGAKSFFYTFQFDGHNKRLTIGSYPEISLAEARKRHAEARKQVADGINPAQVTQNAKREEQAVPTMAKLADEYMEKWAKPRKRSWEEDARILNKEVCAVWGARKASSITRRDVLALLDAIVERGSPIQANRTLAVIRRMFNFALERSILETSPCVAVRAPAMEQRRDRVLSEEELRNLWAKMDNASMDLGTKLALRLQLLTVQRSGEVVGAEWSEVDTAIGWWTIPAGKVKNKLPHRVPLSRPALEILARVKERSGESQWLVPSPAGSGSINQTSLGHAVRRNMEYFGIEPFTPHDLRRTAASHMTGMGINRLVVSKILNHAESGVTAVYDRHGYDREKQDALNAWGQKLMEIVTGNR